LATAIIQAEDPAEMGAFALTRLRKVLEYRFELLYSRFRMPDFDGRDEAERLGFLGIISGGRDHG
jgi:hypothetical protein